MFRTSIWVIAVAGVLSLTISPAPSSGQESPVKKLPEGNGLAAKYPGDVGIDKDPSVVFVENFEHSSLETVAKRWDTVSKSEIMTLSDDCPPASGGKRSLLVSHVGGKGDGGHLYRRLQPGYEKLFVRFYVKFDKDCAPIHHFFHVGGYNPPTSWAQGGAGIRPRGDQRFTVGIEPHGKSWSWDYYAYWAEMGGSPPKGQTWGNNFLGDNKPKTTRDEWICMETMIQLNDVDESNGELALWMNGKRISHLGKGFPKGKWIFDKFLPGEGGESARWDDTTGKPRYFKVPQGGQEFEGFRWRNDERLKINFLWLLVFITEAPKDHVSKIWFDDIVIAKEYIGPLNDPKAKK
jgi:hypothetical protein